MRVFLTSYREGAVVPPVYDEAVHVQRDGRGVRVRGVVPGAVILQQRQHMFRVVGKVWIRERRRKALRENDPHPGFHISSAANLLSCEGTPESGLSMSLNIRFKSNFQLGHGTKYLT